MKKTTLKKTTLNGTIQSISEHAPKAKKPHTKEQFGYFLAGLIDADGHIDTLGYMRIVFNQKDVSVAYYIKKTNQMSCSSPNPRRQHHLLTHHC